MRRVERRKGVSAVEAQQRCGCEPLPVGPSGLCHWQIGNAAHAWEHTPAQ